MIVRFLADENLRWAFIAAVRALESRIDLLDVKVCGLRGRPDPTILEIANHDKRIVLSHDRRTMVRHFRDRVAAGEGTAGLCIFSHGASVAEIADSLHLIRAASTQEEWQGRIEYLPF